MRDDASDVVAKLKLGDAEADFPAALLERKPWRYTYAARWTVLLDRSRHVESVTYWVSFPRDLDIGELRIGMSRDELAALFPDLLTLASNPETGSAFLQFRSVERGLRRAYVEGGEVVVLETAQQSAKDTPFLKLMDSELARLRARARPVSADPEALLSRWMEDARDLTFDRSLLPGFADWLRTASPDEWHAVARGWNWDNGTAPLYWIIHQPDCDLATAVLIHQAAEPSYYRTFAGDRSHVPQHALDTFDLLIAIRRRIAKRSFRRSEISVEEGLGDLGNGDGLTVPPMSGRDPSSDEFSEGIPISLYLGS